MATALPRSATDEAERLARLVGDPERLLPGEEPGTTDLEDAEHWVEVHRQLLELRTELLEDLRQKLARASRGAVAAGLHGNLRTLSLTVARSRSRHESWVRRVQRLRST